MLYCKFSTTSSANNQQKIKLLNRSSPSRTQSNRTSKIWTGKNSQSHRSNSSGTCTTNPSSNRSTISGMKIINPGSQAKPIQRIQTFKSANMMIANLLPFKTARASWMIYLINFNQKNRKINRWWQWLPKPSKTRWFRGPQYKLFRIHKCRVLRRKQLPVF